MAYTTIRGLLLLYAVLMSALSYVQPIAGHTARGRACDELRREMMTVFQQAHENKIWPTFLQKLLPEWVELSLPVSCSKRGHVRKNVHLSSASDNRGPVKTLGTSGTIYSMSSRGRGARGIGQENVKIKEELMGATLRERRSTYKYNIKSHADGQNALVREKRFLGAGLAGGIPDFTGMSLGSASPGPAREVSESAQMMNNLLMFTRLQKNRLAQEYSTIGRRGSSYAGDRVSFGTGMYGDTYSGRRKREAIVTNKDAKVGSSAPRKTESRKKRFIFGGELAEGPPSLLSIFLGTAQDPNTGKTIEFGGDVMRRSLANTFSFFLPPGLQPPPGKEPGDFVKNIAPLFFSNFGSSAGSAKRQNRNGMFGDAPPVGKRRKRSSVSSSDTDKVRRGL